MRNIWWVSAVMVLAFVGLARAADDAAPSPTDDDAILGAATAPVTIFEYASLTCPHCAEFDAETFPKVKEEWIDTGKARLIYRDYPLDQSALKAAVLARCAPADRFYGFIDVLFHSQTNWAVSGDVNQSLSRIARLGGISEEKFDACMKDQKLIDRVVAERLLAQNQYGVNSTPTFFINGKKLVGALPYPEFSKALSAATADAGTSHYAASSHPQAASD